jgi:PAS domain S-box-containing protein
MTFTADRQPDVRAERECRKCECVDPALAHPVGCRAQNAEMNLQSKFGLTVAVAAFGLLTLSGFWLHSERSHLLTLKEEQARNLVNIPYAIVVQQHRLEDQGRISRAEAQRRVIELLKEVRCDDGNYFWIDDMHPTMVMHPIQSRLDGTDLTNYKDPQGKALFVDAVATVREHGQGFIRYRWPRPGREKEGAVPKISFVRGFEPWGWVIGTGIYLDDVDAVWHARAAVAAAVAAGCFLMLLLVSIGVTRSIFPRLSLVVTQMGNIARGAGDFSQATALSLDGARRPAADEVTLLMSGFNEMLVAIRKRDEQLRRHSEQLEDQVAARTADLAASHEEVILFLECIPSILIGLDRSGRVMLWNQTAAKIFGISEQVVKGQSLASCGIQWHRSDMDKQISRWLESDSTARYDDIGYQKEGTLRFVGVSVRPVLSKLNTKVGFIVTGADITERKLLEEQLRQAQKLEAVGQLAAGIAHEINTPTQYVANNATFLKESSPLLMQLLSLCRDIRREAASGAIPPELLAKFDRLEAESDLCYLEKEIPKAIEQSLDGLQRISKIVRAMKEFSHPGCGEKVLTDINRAIETTITVAKNEWKYVAELDTEFDSTLPLVPCLQGEFNQVILNLIVNAAQAIAGVVGDGSNGKGRITITTRRVVESVEIAVRDTGAGIPNEIQSRIFEPFLTTKPMGQGTGQGLSMAHSTIVRQHQGRIWFETEVGRGTTFFVQLPMQAPSPTTTNP